VVSGDECFWQGGGLGRAVSSGSPAGRPFPAAPPAASAGLRLAFTAPCAGLEQELIAVIYPRSSGFGPGRPQGRKEGPRFIGPLLKPHRPSPSRQVVRR
jgi:hypothetical protein